MSGTTRRASRRARRRAASPATDPLVRRDRPLTIADFEGDWEPSYEGEVRPVDAYTILEFTCGGCGAFATALHDRTGWPIVAEYESDDAEEIAHVWVERPDGRAVDIQGVHEGARAVTRYAPDVPGRMARITRGEAADRDMGAGSHLEWSNQILDAYGERFGLVPKAAPSPA